QLVVAHFPLNCCTLQSGIKQPTICDSDQPADRWLITWQSWFRHTTRAMQQIDSDLWQSDAEYPFDNALTTHAYLWTRATGNVLFYSTGHAREHEHMRKLGGLTHQYLSHRDEAGPPLTKIRAMF